MKNTLENKAKFFAQYFEQNIVRSILPEQDNYLTKVDADKFKIPHLIINSYLELKPLSSISDEDVELIGYDNAKSFLCEYKLLEKFLSRNEADQLRLLGYACEWNNITVDEQIEYGWIKLKDQ